MIENFQARYLVHTPIAFAQYSGHFDFSAAKRSRLSVAAEDARFLLDPAYVQEKSLETLKRYVKIVGTTDRLQGFLQRVAQEFSFSLPEQEDVPFENVSPLPAESTNIVPETLELVKELTRIDQELYDRCKQTRPVG
jgi:hypothetical protein